ncbi:MAG TPA: DUF3306 domain-containing protein [Salinarimonas sp.]|nr:DUF3306 domain-containing protein [Salinarimonas sp.]
MSRDGDGFLSRWSRRKAEAARAPDAPLAPEPSAAADPAPAEPAAGAAPDPDAITPEEIAALPPMESIGPDTDIAGFLRKGVPAALRKAALRRVWAADPAIRDYVNEAREYAYDWNVPGGVPGSGALDPEEAKALLARFLGGGPAQARPGVTPEPERVAQAPGSPPGAEPAPRTEIAETRQEVEEPEAGPAPPPATAPDPRPKSVDAEAPPRPRRHGGATPL